ncbi:MAG: hypothetical protein EBS90_11945, partial [Betaproteobacteria bacterium]|nr:hypothetical protein [Betaproteobacteria bacterium]
PDAELSRLLIGYVGGKSKAEKMLRTEDLGSGGITGDLNTEATKALVRAAKAGLGMQLKARPLQVNVGSIGSIPIASTGNSVMQRSAGIIEGTALGASEALIRNPKVNGKTVRQKTVEDVAHLPEAIIGGLGQLAYDTGKGVAEGDYLRGPRNTATAIVRDYKERYAPLVRGDYQAFEKGIEKRGSAMPEALDLTAIASVGGATGGRVLGAAARKGALGAKAERFATAPRPGLRVAGNKVKEQQVSKNLFRLAGQRLEDVRRTRAHNRYAKKATEKGAGIEGLVPNKGEVVALRSPIPGLGRFINNQRRLGQKEQGRLGSEATSRMDKGKNFVTRVNRNAQINLSKRERTAFPLATQAIFPLAEEGGYDIARSITVLKSYRKQIEAERQAAEAEAKRIEQEGGRPASASPIGLAKTAIKKVRERVDTLAAIDKILADPEAHLTPNLAKQAQVVMDELGPIDAGVLEGTAARRKARPQAEVALKALRPTVAEVERDLPPRLQPYDRPMTTREIFDTLTPEERSVEAFDPRATAKSLDRNSVEIQGYNPSTGGVNQTRWFSGQSVPLTKRDVDFSKFDVDADLGPGIYATHDPQAAKMHSKFSYRGAKQAKRGSVHELKLKVK